LKNASTKFEKCSLKEQKLKKNKKKNPKFFFRASLEFWEKQSYKYNQNGKPRKNSPKKPQKKKNTKNKKPFF
jgi:hypothetical protein